MSGELRIASATGAAIYGHIFNPASLLWNGTGFEAYDSGSYPDYTLLTTEQGSSGVYVGDFPVGITDAGEYEVIFYLREGAAPAEGDPVVGSGTINWDGDSISADEDVAEGEMTGIDWQAYVLRTFKRTDKTAELFDATNAAIAEIRRKFTTGRDEKETATTDVIGVLGEYRLDLESDYGLSVSDVFIRDNNSGRYLTPISKSKYDQLYGIWGSGSASQRSIPVHYCLFGGQILLGPIPDSISYTYVVSYSRGNLAPATIATLSVPYTTEDYKEILRDGALWRLYKLVENDDQAGAYKALWDNGLLDIERKERRNRRISPIVAYHDV
jgi:hypothetical protein